ncbi:hypothetical protein, partial [Rhodoplanes roseus]|uniref:hypothetical protein n=1 Tax=Rhodoplanes roseus TaxID=29409 RepID=UPI0011B3FE72
MHFHSRTRTTTGSSAGASLGSLLGPPAAETVATPSTSRNCPREVKRELARRDVPAAIACRYRPDSHSAFQIPPPDRDIRITGAAAAPIRQPKEIVMTRSKIALLALVAATLVSGPFAANA